MENRCHNIPESPSLTLHAKHLAGSWILLEITELLASVEQTHILCVCVLQLISPELIFRGLFYLSRCIVFIRYIQ